MPDRRYAASRYAMITPRRRLPILIIRMPPDIIAHAVLVFRYAARLPLRYAAMPLRHAIFTLDTAS